MSDQTHSARKVDLPAAELRRVLEDLERRGLASPPPAAVEAHAHGVFQAAIDLLSAFTQYKVAAEVVESNGVAEELEERIAFLRTVIDHVACWQRELRAVSDPGSVRPPPPLED